MSQPCCCNKVAVRRKHAHIIVSALGVYALPWNATRSVGVCRWRKARALNGARNHTGRRAEKPLKPIDGVGHAPRAASLRLAPKSSPSRAKPRAQAPQEPPRAKSKERGAANAACAAGARAQASTSINQVPACASCIAISHSVVCSTLSLESGRSDLFEGEPMRIRSSQVWSCKISMTVCCLPGTPPHRSHPGRTRARVTFTPGTCARCGWLVAGRQTRAGRPRISHDSLTPSRS